MKEFEKRTWLVKSSGRILGPFEFDDIVELLRSRRISIIDEIREPRSRWNFVREYKQFEPIIQQLRAEEAQFLDQETEAGQRTHTIKDLDVSNREDYTPIPEVLATKVALPKPSVSVPVYGVSSNQGKSSSRSWLRLIWIVAAFCLVGSGYFYYLQKSIAPIKSLSSEDLVKLARVSKNTGAYESALEFYRKAEALKPLDFNSKLQMSILLLEVSNQTVEARRIIDALLPQVSASEAIRKDVQLASGLSFMKDSSFGPAEQVYQSILFSDSSQMEARLNLGLLHLLKSDFAAANKEFATLQRDGAQEPLVLIGRAIANLGLNEGKASIEKLKSSVEDLDRLNSRSSEFRLESLLIQAVLSLKIGDSTAAEKSVSQLLAEDPLLTKDHIHSLFIDRQIIKWNRLAMYCDFLMTKLQETALSKGLGSFCSFQKEETALALQRIDDARNQFVQNSELIGLQAAYLFAANRKVEAQQVAKVGMNSSILAERIYALGCEEQSDWACAEQSWKHILAQRGSDLGALRGLGYIQFVNNSRDRALDFVKRGLLESSSYRPLLELKERMDAP